MLDGLGETYELILLKYVLRWSKKMKGEKGREAARQTERQTRKERTVSEGNEFTKGNHIGCSDIQ